MSNEAGLLPEAAATMEVSPAEVGRWYLLPAAERPRLIDCREVEELEICRIEGAEWVPLGLFPSKIGVLTEDVERGVVVFCHHGMRSLRAAGFLRAQGVEKAFSMSGGIDEWSQVVDGRVGRY